MIILWNKFGLFGISKHHIDVTLRVSSLWKNHGSLEKSLNFKKASKTWKNHGN